MILGKIKPRYKNLKRLNFNVWNTLKFKNIKHKGWRIATPIIIRLSSRKNFVKILNYHKTYLFKFPTYLKKAYKINLLKRLHIRYIYGYLQHYKIKKITIETKYKKWLNYIQNLEQTPASFLYRINLIPTYYEAIINQKSNYICVSGRFKIKKLKKNDILEFNPIFKTLLKRRLLLKYFNFLNNKFKRPKKNIFYLGMQNYVDFDSKSFRFIFLEDIKYFKNHPFRIPFKRILRWYTRI
jgi:hypothetical protein